MSPELEELERAATARSDSLAAYPLSDYPNSSLHAEFRTLTMLLSLVTAMNNLQTGLPTLVSVFEEEYHDPLETAGQTTQSLAMNAAAVIFSRDTEIVAVAGPSSSSQQPTYLLAIQDESQVKDLHFMNTVVAYPDDTDMHIQSEGGLFPSQFSLLKAGTSHWPSIIKDPWYGLTLL
jgi:hypothetical protein